MIIGANNILDSSYGLLRVASVVPNVNVADIDYNVDGIVSTFNDATSAGAKLVVYPELCITAYTCADLLINEHLLDEAERGLSKVVSATAGSDALIFVGVPLRADSHLFNVAVAIQNGTILGVVPKTYIPNYKEFYEKRWFTTGNLARDRKTIEVCGDIVPFGNDLIFNIGNAKVYAEICEDLWVPVPPSSIASINGANVIVNLSASNEVIGKHNYLVSMIKHHSNHCINAYLYSSSGYGESSTDLVFAGNAIIVENGTILKESKRFAMEPQIEIADIDIESLNNERRVNGSFTDSRFQFSREYRFVDARNSRLDYDNSNVELLRNIKQLPFVPSSDERLNSRCQEIINIVTSGLMRRLEFTHINSLVIGISGGVDSTLALMVATEAFDRLKYDRKNIIGITMPGFGTTGRTYNNALKLMEALGVTIKEISIVDSVNQHFKDIEQDKEIHDVTYENSQARERTQILMDYANKCNALVLGTGDLSELALGWATYNGDHMSMYNVNGSIPKTLAKHLIMWFASSSESSTPSGVLIHETLLDVLNTPISPELKPADDKGNIKQITEDIVGPYELHDFFLYYVLRHGFGPRKIYFLANKAFKDQFDRPTIKKWITVFFRRFFNQQFKRSCLPDGPKVGNVSLSPRGDWRMPSDASSKIWLKECAELID